MVLTHCGKTQLWVQKLQFNFESFKVSVKGFIFKALKQNSTRNGKMAFMKSTFDFSDFSRFSYDEVFQNSDFFEQTDFDMLKWVWFDGQKNDILPQCVVVRAYLWKTLRMGHF